MPDQVMKRANIVVPFLQAHKNHRDRIRVLSKESNPNLLTAHQFIFSALVSYQNRIQGVKFSPQPQSMIERMFLVAQFIQGLEHAETAISEGLYAQAAGLLKQELETLCTIEEVAAGSRIDGKTPKFRGRMSKFGRRYGEYNELAHPTRKSIVESLGSYSEGEKHGPTTIPQFDSGLFKRMYGDQAMLMVIAFNQMREVFIEVFECDWDDAETSLATNAVRILVEEGIIKKEI